MIGPLQGTENEGDVLRGLLGMMIKKRTTTDRLEIHQEELKYFLSRYSVGVTVDDVASCYMILVQEKK